MIIFVEPICDQFEIPVGGEAIVRLEDGLPHSIEIQDDLVVVYDEGVSGSVEVVSPSDQRLDKALQLAVTWLFNLEAPEDAAAIKKTIEEYEPSTGYFNTRAKVFGAFYAGFTGAEIHWPIKDAFDACYRSGKTAKRLNQLSSLNPSFPGFGVGPFDTDLVRREFKLAAEAVVGPADD